MRKRNKPAVVIDTNLLISAIILKDTSIPNQLLSAWRKDDYHMVMSEELFEEIENVLKREKIYKKYTLAAQEITEFLTELRNSTVVVTGLWPF